MNIKVDWSVLKDFATTRKKSIQYVEMNDVYYLVCFDNSFCLRMEMKKDGGADCTDFEDNFKPAANRELKNKTVSSGLSEPSGFRARLVGSHFDTIPKGTSKDIDFQIPNVQYLGQSKQTYFDGVEYCAANAEVGDKLSFQVVDVDNILGYGAGFVAEEFATGLYVMPDNADRTILYKAKLIVGLYVRIKYVSTGSVNDVKLICNLFRHLAENEDI